MLDAFVGSFIGVLAGVLTARWMGWLKWFAGYSIVSTGKNVSLWLTGSGSGYAKNVLGGGINDLLVISQKALDGNDKHYIARKAYAVHEMRKEMEAMKIKELKKLWRANIYTLTNLDGPVKRILMALTLNATANNTMLA
jgi:hypothetical protein